MRRPGGEAKGWEEKHWERSQHVGEGGGAKTVNSLISSAGTGTWGAESTGLPCLG